MCTYNVRSPEGRSQWFFTGLWRVWQAGSLVRRRRPKAIQIGGFDLLCLTGPVELSEERLQRHPSHQLVHGRNVVRFVLLPPPACRCHSDKACSGHRVISQMVIVTRCSDE